MSQTGSLEGDILSYINSNLETDDAAVRGNLLNKIAEMGVDLTEGGRLAALRSLVLTNGPSTRSSRITSTELKTKQPPFLDLSQFDGTLRSSLEKTRQEIRTYMDKDSARDDAYLRQFWSDPKELRFMLSQSGLKAALTANIGEWRLDELSAEQKTSFCHDCAVDALALLVERFESRGDV